MAKTEEVSLKVTPDLSAFKAVAQSLELRDAVIALFEATEVKARRGDGTTRAVTFHARDKSTDVELLVARVAELVS